MSNRAEKEKNEIIMYIGKNNADIISAFDKKQWEFFKNLNIEYEDSYYVIGDKNSLDKFKAYFLVLNSARKVPYKEYALSDFMECLKDPEYSEDFLLESGRSLLIVRHHNQECGTENTELWVTRAFKNRAANRKMKGLTTLFLSERDFIGVKSSGIFKFVDLREISSNNNASNAMNAIKENKDMNKSSRGFQP